MIIITGYTFANNITTVEYFSRYDTINSWTLQDHSSRIVLSGLTTLTAVNGKIIHNINYVLEPNFIYTYKAFFDENLSSQILVKFLTNERESNYTSPTTKNTFKSDVVVSGDTINVSYYSRYDTINKWEVLDHNSRIILSGDTSINAINGKIEHDLTYTYAKNGLYTYKSYYNDNLSNQTQIRYAENRTSFFKTFVKAINTFKTRLRDTVIDLIDGGSSTFVGDTLIDGGSATQVGTTLINGNGV